MKMAAQMQVAISGRTSALLQAYDRCCGSGDLATAGVLLTEIDFVLLSESFTTEGRFWALRQVRQAREHLETLRAAQTVTA